MVPDVSNFTCVNQEFGLDLQHIFDYLVDLTAPICQMIDSHLASMFLFDTSGIEEWVKESNSKFENQIIRQLKAFKKAKGLDDSYAPYDSMPPHTTDNPAIRQMYINGHFCYAYKFGLVTNSLSIVRDITFYNQDFLKANPDIMVEKKPDSPDDDKSIADSKALIPLLKDFFKKHPLIHPKTFLGDAAFNTIQIHLNLLHGFQFEKTGDVIACCPKNPSLSMKREGSRSHLRYGLPTIKFVCHKMKWETDKATRKSKRICHRESPCTDSSCGRMFYIYTEKNLRAYPGAIRGTAEWDRTYKVRVNVEKSINHLKDSFCVAKSKTQTEKHSILIFFWQGLPN